MEGAEVLLQEHDEYGKQGLFCKSILYFGNPCYSSTTYHSTPPYQAISTNSCQLISKIYFYLFLRA